MKPPTLGAPGEGWESANKKNVRAHRPSFTYIPQACEKNTKKLYFFITYVRGRVKKNYEAPYKKWEKKSTTTATTTTTTTTTTINRIKKWEKKLEKKKGAKAFCKYSIFFYIITTTLTHTIFGKKFHRKIKREITNKNARRKKICFSVYSIILMVSAYIHI